MFTMRDGQTNNDGSRPHLERSQTPLAYGLQEVNKSCEGLS